MSNRKVAIVTGGTRGMGQAVSITLAKAGMDVIALYRSNELSAKETKQKMDEYGGSHTIIRADVTIKSDIDAVMEQVNKEYGRVDVLVSNAGIFGFNFIENMTEEYLDHILAVNFKSAFLMTKAVLPYMKKQKSGRIVYASSISSHYADCGLVGYGASKACIDILTKIGSAELGPYNITVNAYAPGIIETDMTADMIHERGEDQVKQISLNKFGKGQDVANLVQFLVSPDGGYITGEIIGVDGGMLKVQNPYRAYEKVKDE